MPLFTIFHLLRKTTLDLRSVLNVAITVGSMVIGELLSRYVPRKHVLQKEVFQPIFSISACIFVETSLTADCSLFV